jgi:hypothetical protein
MPKESKKLVLNQETLWSLTETGTKAAENLRSGMSNDPDQCPSFGDTDVFCQTC